MVDKEEMIDVFEDLYSNLKMEAITNSVDVKGNRQLFGQIQGFFLAMRMVVPLEREEIEYVEHRMRSLEEKLL
jgi:ABC-type uncharacterized transport system permease subunit